MGIRKIWLAAGLVVLALGIWSPRASAQGGARGFFGGESAFQPAVTRTELETYGDLLGLDDQQRDAAEMLLEGYVQAFQSRAAEARERIQRLMEEARESRDRTRWMEMGEYRMRFQEEAREMEQGLLADLRTLLTPEQASRWELVERTRRRERTLGQGQMSGERVDVIRLTRELELDPALRSSIDEVLAQYELDLDRALVKRNEAYERIRSGFGRMRDGDFSEMEDLMNAAREASRRVRDVNERYARQVSGLLPEDLRASFEKRVREAAFPQVYRASRVQRQLDAALEFEDLSDEQRERLGAIRASYLRDSEALNERLARAWREAEDSMEIRQMFRGGLNEGELGELRRQRRELDQQFGERLREVLTDEQLDRLPREQEDRGRRFFDARRGQRGRALRGGGETRDAGRG